MKKIGDGTQETQDAQLSVVHRMLASKPSVLTREAYRQDLNHFGRFLGVDISAVGNDPEDWAKLDTSMIASYFEHLDSEVSKHTGRKYSTATKARRMTAVRELLTEAGWLDLYPKNKIDYVKERLPKIEVSNQHHPTITGDDQQAILETAYKQPGIKGVRDYMLFRLWLETGLRRAELVNLKVEDIIKVAGVTQVVVRHGKGDSSREIGVTDGLADAVTNWLILSGQRADKLNPLICQVRKFKAAEGTEYRVVAPGKHLIPYALNKLVKAYVKMAGITNRITPHCFRVALVTDAMEGGAPIQHVQRVTGHSTTRMITEVYDRNKYKDPVSQFRKHSLDVKNDKRGDET